MSGLQKGARRSGLGLLVLAVVLVGLNLRGPIVGVPPLLADIRADLDLSPAAAGLVTGLPLAAFAVLSPLVPPLARRLGLDRTLLLSLFVLGVALLVRPWGGSATLLIGTAAVGAAITVGNVVVPVLVRRDAAGHVPAVMAASTGAYGVGQALATFLAVPVALVAGWRWSITLPATLILLAILAWLLRMSRNRSGKTGVPVVDHDSSTTGPVDGDGSWGGVFRLPGAWWLALFFGLQSMLFYTVSTWMPVQLGATAGVSPTTAGNALTVFHLTGIAGILLVPFVLRRLAKPRRLGAVIGAGWLIFFVGVHFLPALWSAWMTLGGVVQGAGIGLSLTLIATRPIDSGFGRYVSGMVQGVGYAIAAVGPLFIGWTAERTGGWSVPSVILALCAVVMVLLAPRAAAEQPLAPAHGPGREPTSGPGQKSLN